MRTMKVTRKEKRLVVTRAELTEVLNANEDSIGRWARHDGLGAAVVTRGGGGQPQEFDLAMAVRWMAARKGILNQSVLEDFKVRASLPLKQRLDAAW